MLPVVQYYLPDFPFYVGYWLLMFYSNVGLVPGVQEQVDFLMGLRGPILRLTVLTVLKFNAVKSEKYCKFVPAQ